MLRERIRGGATPNAHNEGRGASRVPLGACEFSRASDSEGQSIPGARRGMCFVKMSTKCEKLCVGHTWKRMDPFVILFYRLKLWKMQHNT